MRRRTVLKTSGVLATGAAMTLAGCSADQGGNGDTTTTPGGNSNTVQMVTSGGDYYFDPIGISVETGDTVTFEIESGSHSATAYVQGEEMATVTRIPEGASFWNSGTLSGEGTTYEHTFETAGTYDYYCIPHKALGMVGRIVVDEPGGPAEGSMPPDGDVPESETIVEQGSVSYSEFSG